MARPLLFLLRLLLLLPALLAMPGMAQEPVPEPVRIGVLAYRGTEQALRTWQGHADYLAQKIPGQHFVVVPLSYPALTEAVSQHRIELLITNTGHYTELEASGDVSRIATRLIAGPDGPLNRFGGTAITLPERTDIQHYSDLKGKRLLIPDKSSLGGWQVHLREALSQQTDLEEEVSRLVETENHEKVVEGVLAGEADAGFIRSDLIESMIANGRLKPGALKIIDTRQTAGYPFLHSTRLYPEWPLARVGSFPEEISKQILVALLAMTPDDAAARSAHIHGWTLPQNYQSVLDLFREARLGPYAHQEVTWGDIMARYGAVILLSGGGLLLAALLALSWIARSNRQLRDNEASLRLAAGVFSHAEEGILMTDASGKIVEANASTSRLTGYSRAELLGQTPRIFRSGRQNPAFYVDLWKTLRSHGVWRGELWNKRKDGTIYAQQTSISSITGRDGQTSHYVALFSDITPLKESQAELQRQAHFDALTGLPNRILLADRLKQAIARSNRNGETLAVCYLDLDNFKPINDRWGHQAGDRLLVEVARRLTHSLREDDTVSRLGGDEFVILIGQLKNFAECEQTLVRISEALSQPFPIESEQLRVTASIGVTLCPNDGTDPDTLLRHADQAMYGAKQGGRQRYQLFQHQAGNLAEAHRAQLAELHRALEQGEFVLHYQPKADMRHGRIIGLEALLRWQHPEKGLLLPESFLAMIDQTGLHVALGNYVLEAALAQMARWSEAGHPLAVSLNIDAQHFQQPDFAALLTAAFARHPGVAPELLEIEIVETAALQDLSQVSLRIADCRKLGIQFAIDDFGTGYSSLSYLKQLPMQTLKIDCSFVKDMLEDPDDLAIVDGVVGLASAFRRQVIAEGVETVAHGTMLLRLGCDLGQGFIIAKALPAAEVPDWIATWQAPPEWLEATRWPSTDLPLLTIEVDHIRWIKQFEAYILGTPSSNQAMPPLETHACRFGQWLNGEDHVRYQRFPAFQRIIPLHDNVHRCAQMLAALHLASPDKAREGLSKLFDLRDALLEQLRELHRAVLKATSGD